MMDWIKFNDEKPEQDILALVFNEKGFMSGGDILALYSHHYDSWRLYDPQYRESITVEVSHYFPIPTVPKLLDKQ